MKSIKKVLKKLGEIFNRVLDEVLDALIGQKGDRQPELIPIPVKDRK